MTYEELKPLTEQPSDDVMLIDVREPDEVIQGSIPSSVNLPLSTLSHDLEMDEGDFTKKYGYHKPAKNQPIVLYCRSGKRSDSAMSIMTGKRYKALRNYEGSWLDWVAKEKK